MLIYKIIQAEQKVFYWTVAKEQEHLFPLEQNEPGCPLPPPQGSEVTEQTKHLVTWKTGVSSQGSHLHILPGGKTAAVRLGM